MTIKQLQTDEPGLPRAGIIRLGKRVETGKKDKNGNPGFRPVEADHFVLTDAPGVAEAVGTAEPKELGIYFPFDDIDLVFPAYMQQWQASALVCRGDGEHITYAIDPQTGKQKVRDGVALMNFQEGRQPYTTGEIMRCPGPERNLYPKCEFCKPNAMLIVLLRDVPRLAYYQISTTSIHNIIDLTKQLNMVKEAIGQIIGTPRLTGVPFILKRVKRSISVPKNGGGRQRVEKYFLQLEIEPEWVLSMLAAQRRLADPMIRFALPETVPTPVEEKPVQPPKAGGFSDPPVWEPVEDGEFEPVDEPAPVQPEPLTEPEPLAPKPGKATRPLSAIQLFDFLHRKAGDGNGGPATEKQLGLLAGKLEECFAPDDDARAKRLAAIRWLWGVDTSKDLTLSRAKAMLDWLLAGAQDQTGDYPLHPAAPEEAKRAYREAMIAAGQVDMFTGQDLSVASGGAAYAD